MSKTNKEYKISSYLRLAELCSPSDSDKKQYYMSMVEQLLEDECESDEIPSSPLNRLDRQVIDFVNEVSLDSCVEIANAILHQKFTEWQTEHAYPNEFNCMRFCRSFAKTQPVRKVYLKDENRKTISAWRKVG